MTKNQRILTYDSSYQYASSAMVRTDDNFHYSIQVGGDDNRATSEGTDNDGGGQMPTWSVVLLFVSIGLIFLGWCTYAAYSAYFPSESPQVAQDQQTDSEIKLSRKQRKALLLQYFERTGTQMVSLPQANKTVILLGAKYSLT